MTATRKWTGRILTGLVTAFLLLDGGLKVVAPDFAASHSVQLGFPGHLIFTVGIIELGCLAIYLVPQTSALGAVLLTGFLGGAIATHFRVEDPLLGYTLFPLYVGGLAWAGLLLRDRRLQLLVPFQGRV
jgi:hypothetical protein